VANPATNLGVLLQATNGESYATFRFPSRNYWDATKLPQLIVTYGVP
jgi:hypothetical protein